MNIYRCSFDPFTQDMSNKSHILATTTVMWALPLLIILVCYFHIVQAVFKHEDELRQQAKKMNVASLRSNSDQKAMSAEIRIAKISMMTVGAWCFAWTPFMVVCMMGSWGGDPSWITAFIQQLPVFMAKTTCCLNPMIYALSHPKYREVILDCIRFNSRTQLMPFFSSLPTQCMKELYPWLCIMPDTKPKRKYEDDSASTHTTQDEKS